MRTANGLVEEETLSQAWLRTLEQVSNAPDRKQFHTVTRIADPTMESEAIRAAAEAMLSVVDNPPVETVANTIFPNQLAATTADAGELVARYRNLYSVIRRVHRDNRRGTYFGRIVEYPAAGQKLDQLSSLIRKLTQERGGDRPKSARYEVPIVVPELDTAAMAFPCLSHCSFQLDRDRLHFCAHYRSQYLVRRGYGNYLGLARLQAYVARTTGLQVGQLTIVAGLAHADAPKYRVQIALEGEADADRRGAS